MDNKSFQQICVFLIRWSESGGSILKISLLFGKHQFFVIISLTYIRSIALLEKLIGSQLVKKFLAF